MKRYSLALVGLLALTACVKPIAIDTPPVDVQYTDRAASTGIVKFATPSMRTMRFGEDGKRVEVSGASCKMQGSGFKASFVTPAIVRVPMRNGKPDNLVVTCTDGTATRTQQFAATNLTAQRIQNSGGAAGGLIGALVASAIVASRDTSKDQFDFMSFALNLNDKP